MSKAEQKNGKSSSGAKKTKSKTTSEAPKGTLAQNASLPKSLPNKKMENKAVNPAQNSKKGVEKRGSKSVVSKPAAAAPAIKSGSKVAPKPIAKAKPISKSKPLTKTKPPTKTKIEDSAKAPTKSANGSAGKSVSPSSKGTSKVIGAKGAPSKPLEAKSKVAAESAASKSASANQAIAGNKAANKSSVAEKLEPSKKAPMKPPASKMVATKEEGDGKGTSSKSSAKSPKTSQAAPKGIASPVKEIASKPESKKGLDKGAIRVSPPAKPKVPVSPPTNPKVVKKIRELQNNKELKKDLSQDIVVPEVGFLGTQDINHDPQKDRMVLVVRDSYWLHASWEITRRSVDRARAAMAEHWHTVRPVLRVLRIDNSGTTNNSETILRDIEIHGGVRNWYIDVIEPPSSFRVLLGYVAGQDRFHELVRSNIVTTPIPGSDEAVSTHWADIAKDAERIFALSGGYNDERETKDLQDMFEEHLKRPMGAPALAQFGNGAEGGMRRNRHFHFDLDAEMVVFGSTHPNAYVTLGGEPVKVHTDGTFSVRVPLPDRRQVLPATACTRDGVDEQTIVIAVERNTKVMEPLSKENAEEAS